MIGGFSTRYELDVHGRRYIDGPNEIAYNEFDLPASIFPRGTPQNPIASFAYTPGGVRFWKRADGMDTLTVSALYEKRAPAGGGFPRTHTFRVPAGDRVVAEIDVVETVVGPSADSRRYLHLDRIGSIEVVTDAGSAPSRQRFEPYGGFVDPANPGSSGGMLAGGSRRGFTGHEHDTEFGYINMGGRIYDPRSASFLTPDPVLTSAPNIPHSYNPYAYALHNPTGYVDPTGFSSQCVLGYNVTGHCYDDYDWEEGGFYTDYHHMSALVSTGAMSDFDFNELFLDSQHNPLGYQACYGGFCSTSTFDSFLEARSDLGLMIPAVHALTARLTAALAPPQSTQVQNAGWGRADGSDGAVVGGSDVEPPLGPLEDGAMLAQKGGGETFAPVAAVAPVAAASPRRAA